MKFTLQEVQNLEQPNIKLARHRNHLKFNLHCNDAKVIPASLNIACPIKTQTARDIIDRARKGLLKERIRQKTQKIKFLKEEISLGSRKLASALPTDIYSHVSDVIERSHERMFTKTKLGQQRKLQSLVDKNTKSTSDIDLSGTQLKKWVVNISKHKLSDQETRVLAKGLNFAVSPDKIPHDEFIVATETTALSLPPAKAESLRSDIANILCKARHPKQNISKEDRVHIRSLAKRKVLLIFPADKGKVVVVMDSTEYKEKNKIMLSNVKVYEKLNKDPTPGYKRGLVSLLTQLKKEDKTTRPVLSSVPRVRHGTMFVWLSQDP